jgi:succinate dehydrogenase / fumarate reductase iron-sulfur subunit
MNPDEYVLDAKRLGFRDRTICFRHACHHSTCGACGMREWRGETDLHHLIRDVTRDGAVLQVEPLRNFPSSTTSQWTWRHAERWRPSGPRYCLHRG